MLKNRKCNYCGREYYCCKSCISINSWKNVCCSIDCYRYMIQNGNINMPQEIKNKEGEVMKTLLRAALNNKDTADIIGYDLVNLTDGGDGVTLVGKANPMYGRPWWDENTPQEKIDTWRINHKKGHEHFKGEGNPFYGKKHTQESKIKISKNHADVSGKNNPSANIYKIIKPNGDILYMCGNQIYNNPRKKNDKKGFLNISKDTFNKYIRPYGCVDVTKIKTK